MEASLRLAELLCTRLCEDVVSLLGALNGALDHAADSVGQEMEEPLRGLRAASGVLAGRAALWREAWGNNPSSLNRGKLARLAEGLPNALRLRLDVAGLPSRATFPPGMSRMIVNAMILAAESLPKGGTIEVSLGSGGTMLVAISGTHAAWPPGLREMMADPAAAWRGLESRRQFVAALLVLLGNSTGVRLSLGAPEGRSRRGQPPPPLRLIPR
jgi:histidine phosphotransferase ChpT